MRLVHVTTIPASLNFLQGQIGFMRSRGFEIHGVTSPGELLKAIAKREKIPIHAIPMTRRITPFQDLIALMRFVRLFQRIRPTIVHASTPKGGMLGVLGAKLAKVPIIIYTIRGLPYTNSKGMKRRLLIMSEKAVCKCAHRVFATSFATREQTLADGICPPGKIFVIGHGTGNGIDAQELFNPEKLPAGTRNEVRRQYHIPSEALVVGFVGRIVREKGIIELADAWKELRQKFSSLYLLLVGPIEDHDPVPAWVLRWLQAEPRVRFTGRVLDMPPIYAAMDVLTLPSYREGFGLTPLEANAMLLPAVASRIGGLVDAVVDGVTGLLVPPKNAPALALALEKLLRDPDLRIRMGRAGRERVLRDFRPEDIWRGIYEHYLDLLNKNLEAPNP